MLDENLVFERTALGEAEAHSHTLGVSQKLRRALSLVDGSRSVAQIAPLMRAGEADEILEELQEQGFIAPRAPGRG